MPQSSNRSANGKITSGQRTTVRIALATGATLAMLFSAQMFAAGSTTAAGSATQTTSQTASVFTGQADTTSATTSTTSSQTSLSSSNQATTVLVSQTQPFPSTHSSR